MTIDPLNIGVSALEAYETQIDVAANNIANVATPGFTAQDTTFGDLLSGGVKARIGANQAPQPAALQPTGVPTDLAVAGSGNFVTGANGQLVDASSGYPVTSTSGSPIAIPPGTTGVSVAPDGTVSATFANGTTSALGRLALATDTSGSAQLGAPGAGPYGSIQSGELAGSNVDLAANIISLMAGQTAFEANARSIVTGDEMLGTIINDIK